MPFNTPEKAKAYAQTYNQRPEVKEKATAYMKSYNQRPDVKAKRKQRRRQERLEIYRTMPTSKFYDLSQPILNRDVAIRATEG